MQAKLSFDNHTARISLSGVFTFEAHYEFKQATAGALAREGITAIELDLEGVEYIDSAALGMLLLLKERATGRSIALCNCRGTVKSVLEVANFGKIFDIA